MNITKSKLENSQNYEIRHDVEFEHVDLLAPLIFVGCLMIVGIPGNYLVLIVLYLKHKLSVYRRIIVVLVINYLLVCGISLPFEFYYLNYHFSFRGKWTCKAFRFLNYLFVHNSVLDLQLMAIERFRRVCCPLKVQMSTGVGRMCFLGIFIFSFVYTTTNIFIRGIHKRNLMVVGLYMNVQHLMII